MPPMTLEKILRGVVLAGIFAIPFIPLFVANTLFFPFITGKNFSFRIIVEIIAAAWLALAVISPVYRPRRSLLLGAFALFVLIIGVADAFGVNAFKSFWSNYERMEGWVTLAHLLVFLAVSYSVLTTETLWRRLFHTSIGVSVLAGIYGVFQLAGFITINQGGVRLDATFGNATYLAVYMLFHVFFTAMMWEKAWREGSAKWGTGVMYGAIMLLQTIILFFTATRGAILGLLGGALLSAILLVLLARDSRNAWRASAGVIAVIALMIGGFFMAKNTALVQSVEPLKRLADISLSDGTVASRFMNYQMALQGVKERPLLGWGQEGYNVVFNKYYDPRMYGQEPWFDRVHNIVFDWLIAGGILGFLAYVSIFLAAMWGVWMSGAFSIAERSMLTGLLAAYVFNNIFVFDNITSYIFFIFTLGFIAYRVADARNAPAIIEKALAWKFLPATAVVAVLALWGVAWSVNAAPLTQNRALIAALQQQGSPDASIAAFAKAVEYGSVGTQEAREQLVQIAARAAGNGNLAPEAKGKLFELAEKEMQAQIASAPLDARFPLFLGLLYASYGQHDKAKAALEQARALSPKKQAIILQLAMNANARGKADEALNYLKEAYELEPKYLDARMVYAAALIQSGNEKMAEELLAPLMGTAEVADQRVIAAYAARKNYAAVGALWESKAKANPQDVQARLSVAASYFAAGNKAKAIETLEQIAKDIPAVAQQAQALIQEVKNGTAKLGQ